MEINIYAADSNIYKQLIEHIQYSGYTLMRQLPNRRGADVLIAVDKESNCYPLSNFLESPALNITWYACDVWFHNRVYQNKQKEHAKRLKEITKGFLDCDNPVFNQLPYYEERLDIREKVPFKARALKALVPDKKIMKNEGKEKAYRLAALWSPDYQDRSNIFRNDESTLYPLIDVNLNSSNL